MKKILLIIAVLLIAGSSFSQVQFGVGAVAGTKLKGNDKGEYSMNFGAHARGLFEISDEIYKIDDALNAGFGWKLGPFETWDAIGVKEAVTAISSR